jgi:uncharacterized protein YxjI
MQYPLDLRFTIFSLAQQITVRDASGNSILFVKQKMFRFREKIEVFSDSSQSKKLFEINADRIIDFSANYSFTGADGSDWGSVRRHGMRSLWSAHYEVIEDKRVDMHIREEAPWKKFLESLLSEIPIVGFVFIYFLNPTYLITLADGTPALRATKKPSILERVPFWWLVGHPCVQWKATRLLPPMTLFHERANQAMMPLTTSPWTSVKRN